MEAGVEWLTETIQDQYGLACGFADDGTPKPLEEDLRITLFRGVKELLVNVAKHAQADQVEVSLRRESSQIRIQVEDDGVGFVPSEQTPGGGFGLFSIRERLESFGGRLEVASEPGRGTRVSLVAPLQDSEDRPEEQKT